MPRPNANVREEQGCSSVVSRNYIFKVNSEQTVRRWAHELKIFRFCRAFGGHTNDGDMLKARIAFRDSAERGRILRALDVADASGRTVLVVGRAIWLSVGQQTLELSIAGLEGGRNFPRNAPSERRKMRQWTCV